MLYRRVVLITVSAVACLSAAAVYTSVSGTGGGAVALPVPDARVAGYCHTLHTELPRRLDGLPRHDPAPDSELIAGWGNPAIVLRCGVRRPAADQDVSTSGATVDGVGWSVEWNSDGTVKLTTTLRKAYVEVTLPRDYAHDAGPLTDLAGPISRAIPEGV